MFKRVWGSVIWGVFFVGFGCPIFGTPPEFVREPFAIVTHDAVVQHANKISFSLKKRRIIRASLIAFSSGILLCQGYGLLLQFFGQKEKNGEEEKREESSVQSSSQSSSEKRGWFTASNAKAFGVVGLKVGAGILASQILQIMMGKYIVPDTLSWFVHVCAPYRKVLLEIDAHVIKVGQAGMQPNCKLHYLQSIDSAYRDLISQLTEVLGYMCFRLRDFKSKKAAEAERLVTHLVDMVNECSQQLAGILVGASLDCRHLMQVLDSLGMLMDAGCLQFSRLEGSVWYDGGYARKIVTNEAGIAQPAQIAA